LRQPGGLPPALGERQFAKTPLLEVPPRTNPFVFFLNF
jgi:hypothetical protein